MPGTFGSRTPGSPLALHHVSVPVENYTPASIDALLATPYSPISPPDYFSIPINFDGAQDLKAASDFVMELPDRTHGAMRNKSCKSSPALIKIMPHEDVLQPMTQIDPDAMPTLSPTSTITPTMIPMVYNEYGELVNLEKLKVPLSPDEMNTIQILRIIRRAYHHEVGVIETSTFLARLSNPNIK
jgi:hypothetical protein